MQKTDSSSGTSFFSKKKSWLLFGLSVAGLIIILFFFFSGSWFGKNQKLSKVYMKYIERADRALMNDSLEIAIDNYFKALDIDDQHAITYGKLSESYFFAALRHKQKKNYSMVDAMLNQSMFYFAQGMEKDPGQPYFHYVRGLYLMDNNKTDSAISEMQTSYLSGTRAFYLHLYLSDMYNEREETSLCLEQLKEADRIKPDDPRIVYNLGEIYFRIGDFSNAVKQHYKLTLIDPNSVEYLAIYAASLWKNGDEKTAKNIFNQILHDKNTHHLLRHHVVAWTLIDRDLDYEWGIKVANVSAETKNDITSLDIIGWGYFKAGNYKMAVQYLNTSYNRNPTQEVKRRLEMAQEKLRATGQQP